MNPVIPSTVSPARGVSWRPLALAAALVAAGCSKQEEITTYETPRVEPRAVAVDADELRDALDHMFTAIVPAGDVAWFFKLVARGDNAEALRQPFLDLLATVKVDQGAERPTWTLPEGWSEGPGGEMRAATIVIPHADKKFEIAVSSLPLGADWDDFLQVNVERWMGQLGQPKLTAKKIDELKREVKTAGGEATLFELVGTMQASPMGMAGGAMPAGHPPIGDEPPSASESAPATSQPATSAPGAAATSPSGLVYTAPAGWEPGALSVMGISREAAFVVATDQGRVDVAVTKFPANGQMAALEPNVRRWAGQVGLTNLSPEEIEKAGTKINVGSREGLRFEFFSPADAPNAQGILTAMIVADDFVWFAKLSGSRPAVESQRDAFDQFLASLRLPNDS